MPPLDSDPHLRSGPGRIEEPSTISGPRAADPGLKGALAPSAGGDLGAALARLRAAVVRRKREFLVVWLILFLAIQAVAFFWPGTFAAQAAVLIQKTRSPGPADSDPSRAPTVIAGAVTEEEVNSEIAILTSREVLSATVAAAGLDRVPTPLYLRVLFAPLRWYEELYASYHGIPPLSGADRAIQSLERSISAERLRSSNVVLATLEARDPKVAEVVLDELLKNYLKRHTEVHGRTQVASVFSHQADLLEHQLLEVEESLQRSKHQAGTVDASAERDVQLKIDASLREEADTLRRRLAELDAKLGSLDRESTRDRARDMVSGSILDQLKAEANRLEQEQVKMEARYRPGFPLLEENAKKLERTREALERERGRVFEHNPALVLLERDRAEASAERAGVARRLKVLEEQLRSSRERLLALDEQTTEAIRGKRQARALEERYLLYLQRGAQTQIDAALDENRLTNVSIVQGASASPKPVRPKRTVVLLVSIVGGVLAAILRCAWLELRSLGASALVAALAPLPRS